MEKIDFIKWWSESTLAVRYNALLSVGVLGLLSIIYYQYNERKSDAELYRNTLRERDSIDRNNNKRFDSIVANYRQEVKECNDIRYKESIKNAEMFRTLYEQKQTLRVTYNNGN